MGQISKNNTYYDSDGNGYTQSQVLTKTSQAKAEKIDQMRD